MIGAVADDFTGGTDVAVFFRRSGLRTVIVFGRRAPDAGLPEADAVVVALKSRTIEASEAVRQSSDAAAWLRSVGAEQLFFKYCSTFDSRPEGNIGPVADALADQVGSEIAVVVPASPAHGRTQYQGHLFVHQQLLSDSPMRHHPLTPMTNPRVAEVLASQTTRPVAVVAWPVVRAGAAAVRAELDRLRSDGVRYAVVDALDEDDLVAIGRAVVDEPFVTGAAGLAGGLGAAVASESGTLQSDVEDPVGDAPTAVLAGSCSARTLEQIAHHQRSHPSLLLDAVAHPDAGALAAQALAFYDAQAPGSAPLVYSSLPPDQLRAVQQTLGTAQASEILETAMGLVARGLVERGVRRLVVAGGETSGSVVSALAVEGGLIGPEAAPGVPWIYTAGDRPLALLLKSGNFGEVDMLTRAAAAGSTPVPSAHA